MTYPTPRRRDRTALTLAAAAATAASALTLAAAPAVAGTTPGLETISTSGSTALRNWFVVNTTSFTFVQPGTQATINGVSYPTGGAGSFYSANNSNGIFANQLAPKIYQSSSSNDGITETDPALRFEYNESGSVEGILELANDQIAPVTYVTQNVDRNPTAGVGNAVWVNYNPFGGAAGRPVVSATSTAATGPTANGYTLGNFYANQQLFALGGTAQAAFNTAGGNLNGGQNAVQLAVSDAVPVQVFANSTAAADAHSATPWLRTPQDLNYGNGNTALAGGALGAAGTRQVYQSTANLNMLATATNPRTGSAFGTGPWNSAGLGNLTTQTVATTATLFVANPGTGLTGVDRTDAQFLQTTGRLANGAAFNVVTRDVNSGTRNVAALETGIDPTYAVGANDDGNGNSATGFTGQVTVGPALRFSNKTAGGGELRPTVQANRFAVGTLSINDANGSTTSGNTNPVRALRYSDSADGSKPYVLANYYTIAGVADASANPGGQQYTIFQNEQFVTLKAPDASYNASSPNVQGSPNGDVKTLESNTTASVASYINNQVSNSAGQVASPAAGLLGQGYIIPQLTAVTKAQNGLNVAGAVSAIVPNPTYNTSNSAALTSLAVNSGLVAKLNNGDPATVTAGSSSTVYGGSSAGSAGPAGFNGAIKITVSPDGVTGGNYLAGNFNQNGVRDYDAVVVQAQKAQAALETSGAGVSGFTADGGSTNATTVTTGVAGLDAMTGQTTGTTGATKGDLIAMGDYNGDGRFDGTDLYLLAVGASLSDANSRPTETSVVAGLPTFTTGHINATAANFSSSIVTSVLNKNTALDYLQANHTVGEAAAARAVLTVTTGTTAAAAPAGATFTGTDAVSGLAQFTFDAAGANAFNKTDVNRDGVVDATDAIAVDAANGQDYSNLGNSLTFTIPAPVTGTAQLANLVLLKQVDGGTVIGAADLAAANTALTGVGNSNWYGFSLNKTGPGTVTIARTGGTVTIFPGAVLNVSSGTFAAGGSADPFTDNSGLSTNGTHLNVVNTATLAITAGSKTVAALSSGTTLAGTTTVAAGASLTATSVSQATLSLPGSLVIATGPAGRAELVGSVAFPTTSGSLDLGTADLIVRSSSLSAVAAEVAAGYAGGPSKGAGITSSAAAANASRTTTLGVVQNAVTTGSTLLFPTFDKQPSVAGDVLVKYTYYGDATLDGKVDGSDYARIDAGFLGNGSLTGWSDGDFNYDGKIDASDYTLIDNAFNTQSAPIVGSTSAGSTSAGSTSAGSTSAGSTSAGSIVAGSTDEIAPVVGASAVPEPTTAALAVVGVGATLARRRRRA